jgi:formate-dependent nitrite reductase membrane component NrfD
MQAKGWEFGVKESPAREWSEGMGALIAVAMFLGGIAGGLYLVSLYFNNIWGMLISWIFAMGMGLFDMAHLSKPMRVWRIAFRAGSSWISRGFIFVILFIGAAGLQLLIHLLTNAGASTPGGIEVFFRVVAGILAFGVAVYSGFVVGFVNGIKFWNSAIMPILVVVGGMAGGAAVLLPIASMTGVKTEIYSSVQTFAVLALIVYAVSIFIHLWVSTYNGPAARDSALLLLKGSMSGLFWIVIMLIGVVIPLILEFTVGANSTLLMLNAVLVLVGNLTLRYSIIKAGRYSPLVPA